MDKSADKPKKRKKARAPKIRGCSAERELRLSYFSDLLATGYTRQDLIRIGEERYAVTSSRQIDRDIKEIYDRWKAEFKPCFKRDLARLLRFNLKIYNKGLLIDDLASAEKALRNIAKLAGIDERYVRNKEDTGSATIDIKISGVDE